jgi:cytochrome c oxidase subunit II
VRRRQLILAGTLGGLGTLAGAQPAEKAIAVVARKFVFLPNEIALRRGEPVVLEFTAVEVVMGFFAPDLNLRTVIVPGQVARVRFVPDRVGRFDFLCDIFCGEGHEGMSGRIVVSA